MTRDEQGNPELGQPSSERQESPRGRSLTWKEGVFPEDYMNVRLREEISRAGRYRHYLSLLLVDFVAGHGDKAHVDPLQYGKQIRAVLRSTDVVFILNDGRISIILPETTERESQFVMERLRGDVQTEEQIVFGIASYPHDAGHEGSLVAHAVERLDQHKSHSDA